MNVWAPKEAKNTPVYVFIHGGAYYNGAGSYTLYDGTNLAKQGIVTVTINYRLGALGFLALDTLMDLYGTTGNWGMLDQVKALRWVNDSISSFGGNPENITIGGESAGSFSVSYLLVSPLTEGVFQNYIMESGSTFNTEYICVESKAKLENAVSIGQSLCADFGVTDSLSGLEELRKKDAKELYDDKQFTRDIWSDSADFMWPTFDGFFLPKDAETYLSVNELKDVNILMGHNNDEGSMFNPGMDTKEEFDIIKSHTTIGADIPKNFTAIPTIRDGAHYHHERYDGNGYPSGLKGKDIPLFARIICVADSYDAMTSSRVYRSRLTDDATFQELERNAGKQFDPDIEKIMVTMIRDGFVKRVQADHPYFSEN